MAGDMAQQFSLGALMPFSGLQEYQVPTWYADICEGKIYVHILF